MLEQAICDYLQWLKSIQYKGSEKERMRYEEILNDFALFVGNQRITWKDTFSLDTLKAFRKDTKLSNVSRVVRGLSYYLVSNGTIPQPLHKPNYQIDLPEIYEQYLLYHEQSRQVPYMRIKPIRRVLAAFHDYLHSLSINLSSIRIQEVDAFLAELNKSLAPGSSRVYRFYLRGFLKYLYQERKIISRDLAPLVVGRRLYAQAKPPKFLRPQEIQKLFCSLKLSSAVNIRNYAMVHLAYSLGLRPKRDQPG
jgi:integrase